jgi:isoleucyl-tRNA synthetase
MEGVAAEPFDAWRGVVVLDTKIYPELQAEGWARDFVRLVQSARKQSGLQVTDRINVAASVPPELRHALAEHRKYVARETLAVRFDLVADDRAGDGGAFNEEDIDGYTVRLRIERDAS